MVNLIAEPDAPAWHKRFVLRLRTAFVPLGAMTQPKSFASTALPDPTQTPGAVIYVSDKGTIAVSNGVYWYPVTLSAHY